MSAVLKRDCLQRLLSRYRVRNDLLRVNGFPKHLYGGTKYSTPPTFVHTHLDAPDASAVLEIVHALETPLEDFFHPTHTELLRTLNVSVAYQRASLFTFNEASDQAWMLTLRDYFARSSTVVPMEQWPAPLHAQRLLDMECLRI